MTWVDIVVSRLVVSGIATGILSVVVHMEMSLLAMSGCSCRMLHGVTEDVVQQVLAVPLQKVSRILAEILIAMASEETNDAHVVLSGYGAHQTRLVVQCWSRVHCQNYPLRVVTHRL